MSYWKPGGAKGGDSNSTTPRGGAKSVPGSVEREKNKKTLITPISKPMGIDESSPVLSKSVMSMKFMKRKADVTQQAQDEYKRRKEEESNSWGAAQNTSSGAEESMNVDDSLEYDVSARLTVATTPTDFYSSLPGRRSFGGCNAFIEKEYERFIDLAKFDKAVEKATNNTVSDEEMLQRYESLIGLPRGPNQGKMPTKISGGRKNSRDAAKSKFKSRKSI